MAVSKLNLVVALSWEARPIIRFFGLQLCRDCGPFPLYSDGGGINLIVSGIGSNNVSLAIAYLAGLQHSVPMDSSGWINIGIAGHRTARPGTVLLADKLSPGYSTESPSFYPSLIAGTDLATSEIVTVNAVETDYREDAAYDMEAYSFYQAASRFSAQELIQSLKVVSDGPDHPVESISKEAVGGWMEGLLVPLSGLMDRLATLADEYNAAYSPGKEYAALLERLHFTATEQQRLRRLCQFVRASGKATVLEVLVEQAGTDPDQHRASVVLARLEEYAAELGREG